MSKETIEEAARKIYPDDGYNEELYCDVAKRDRETFIEGAKWQAERSYSEEEVLKLLKARSFHCCNANKISYESTKEWFKQFKKK